jgi:hypothetical protein
MRPSGWSSISWLPATCEHKLCAQTLRVHRKLDTVGTTDWRQPLAFKARGQSVAHADAWCFVDALLGTEVCNLHDVVQVSSQRLRQAHAAVWCKQRRTCMIGMWENSGSNRRALGKQHCTTFSSMLSQFTSCCLLIGSCHFKSD